MTLRVAACRLRVRVAVRRGAPVVQYAAAGQAAGARVALAVLLGMAFVTYGCHAASEKEATDYIQLFDYNVNLLSGALKQIAGK